MKVSSTCWATHWGSHSRLAAAVGSGKTQKYWFQMVLICWRVPLCESFSSELHWLILPFEIAATGPVSLFLSCWYRDSICGRLCYCSQFPEPTLSSSHCSVCLGNDVARWSRSVNRMHTGMFSIEPCPLARCRIDLFHFLFILTPFMAVVEATLKA